ncbi:hypothetical protein HWV62_26578 [Athelia sp. TMB]|nr:hypothetical protein HWV62_26578 [Athelia sp. TMB]
MRDMAARTAVLPTLPVELWAYIVDLSSYSMRLEISRVSRLHRELALPTLLKSLNLTVPRIAIGHDGSDSDITGERLKEYLMLDHFLKNIAAGGIRLLRSLKQLSVFPRIQDSAWTLVDGPAYPNLRSRLSDVIFNAPSLVTFRWNSNAVHFPYALGQALVLGAPQLRCLSIRTPGLGHDLELSPLTQLQQVTIILTNGVHYNAHLRSMGTLLFLPNITELQIPTAVLDSVLETNREANIIKPTLRHLRMHITLSTVFMRSHTLQHIQSLHLQGSSDALYIFLARQQLVPALRFITLRFVPRLYRSNEPHVAATVVIALMRCAPALERLKIANIGGILNFGFSFFRALHRFAHLRVLAMAVKSMACNHMKDLVAALPVTVSTVLICIGNTNEEPEVYFRLFLPAREQLRMLHLHCLTRTGNAKDKQDITSAQRVVSARAAAEKLLADFPKLEAIGTHGYLFEVPRLRGVRVLKQLPILSLRRPDSIFDETDVEWAVHSGSDLH